MDTAGSCIVQSIYAEAAGVGVAAACAESESLGAAVFSEMGMRVGEATQQAAQVAGNQ